MKVSKLMVYVMFIVVFLTSCTPTATAPGCYTRRSRSRNSRCNRSNCCYRSAGCNNGGRQANTEEPSFRQLAEKCRDSTQL